jgi:two-component system CheB/CheR fusion protein
VVRVFRAMPDPPPRAAFVVVTHLGSGHESALPGILGGCTAMPVAAARDGDPVAPGRAYVLPNDAVITIAAGRLALRRQDPAARRERQPIDVFLASLAEDLGERAAGVVLSGTGSDGTLGLKAIKERGGLTLAQGSDGSAPRHPEMPASAVAGGGVDLVLPAEDMPARLAEFARGFSVPDGVAGGDRRAGEAGAGSEADAGGEVQGAISAVPRERTGHDFAGHKEKTFFRRVRRRMQVLRLRLMSTRIWSAVTRAPRRTRPDAVCAPEPGRGAGNNRAVPRGAAGGAHQGRTPHPAHLRQCG